MKINLKELLEAEVITTDTAQDIQEFYKRKSESSTSKTVMIFAVLGALLIGLGIILILAHNWDNLSRSFKTLIAFIPLIVGQGLCYFTLKSKPDDRTWRESSAVFLIISIGACIALISQIYNMEGSLHSFLFIWLILALPVIYLMQSGTGALLYMCGLIWYRTACMDASLPLSQTWYFWILLAAIIPFYLFLLRSRPFSGFIPALNWLIPISVLFGLSMFQGNDLHMILSYVGLLGIFYMIGHLDKFKSMNLWKNGYLIIGAIGTIILLLSFSFDYIWTNEYNWDKSSFWASSTAVAATTYIGGLALLGYHLKNKTLTGLAPIMPLFLIFLLIYNIGIYAPNVATILINLLVLSVAVLTIRKGVIEDHLGILNYGLLIFSALMMCRFFDSHISFVWRGILFVIIGLAFFFTNYLMVKKRNAHDI